MNRRLLPILCTFVASLFATSCETTTGYGYYLAQLNDETILEFFALSDEAANTMDFDFYKSFFSPDYTLIDRTDDSRTLLYRQEYLDGIKKVFDTAKSIFLHTMVMDIQYSDSGNEAVVKIQEEERTEQFGQTRHYTSLYDVELAIEEGWMFITKTTRTTKQVIEE